MMVTSAAINEVGDFDVEVPPSEDWELMFRVARRFRIGFTSEPLVLYRQHAGNAHRDLPRQGRSMMLVLAKVFETGDAELEPLRRRSYATVHRWLAGGYWEMADRRAFMRHAAAAVWLYPPVIGYFVGFPLRRLRRHWSRTASASSRAASTHGRGFSAPAAARRCYFRVLSTVGGPLLLRRLRARDQAVLIVNLHGISERPNPFWPQMRPEHFDALARYLAKNCTVTTFGGLSDVESRPGRPITILSFDDGYRGFVDYAMPILARYGLRANQNVIGACIETGKPPWIVHVCDELAAAPLSALRGIELPGISLGALSGSSYSRDRFGARLTDYLKSFPQDQAEVIWSGIRAALGQIEVTEPTQMMGPDDVRAAIAAGHEIGMHSYSHQPMETFGDGEFVADLNSVRDIVSGLGGDPSIYAFPNGSYRPEQITIAQRHGVEHVLLMGERPSRRGVSIHTRLTVRGDDRHEVVLRALGHRIPLRRQLP